MAKILDGVLIKKANQQEHFSEKQVAEITKCMDPDTGYLYFLKNYFYIQHPVKGKIKFEPYDFQEGMLAAYHNYTNVVILSGRQNGKTTCAAGYLLWFAMFHSDKTILIAAHKFTGAQEIMQRIRYGYELCPDFIRGGVVSYNKGSMDFENGSRIISSTTTATTGRGMSISLLFMDELAYVQPNIAEDFFVSISPTLATGGRAIVSSTPNSDEDMFATIWKESQIKHDEYGNERSDGTGINGYFGYMTTWEAHPDRDEKWKAEEIAKIGIERFRREYNCEFITAEETLINPEILLDMVGKDPMLKAGQVRWYKKPTPDNVYLVALDPSLGTGSDYAAIEVFEMPSMIQVAEWQHNVTPVQQQIKIFRDILKFILKEIGEENNNSIYWSCENNAIGDSALIVIESLGEDTFPGTFLSEGKKPGVVKKQRKGFNTTYATKISACSRLKYLIEEGKMMINSKPMITELKSFIASGMSFKAKPGMNDDLVSALLLVVRMSVILAEWDPRVFSIMSHKENGMDDFIMPMPIFIG